MGRRKKPTQRVTQYFTSIQYAICHGRVERLLSLRVNGKDIPVNPEATGMVSDIGQGEIFGGILKEGGLDGRMAWQDGSDDQLLDSYVASKKGAVPSDLPGYRGIATAFFTERAGQGTGKGFYWSANQPVIHPVHFEVTRIDRSWRPEIAAIHGNFEIGSDVIAFSDTWEVAYVSGDILSAPPPSVPNDSGYGSPLPGPFRRGTYSPDGSNTTLPLSDGYWFRKTFTMSDAGYIQFNGHEPRSHNS